MMDKYIPSRYKSSRHNLPWLTTEVKRMIRRKQRKYYQAKKSCRPEDWKCYKEMKTSVRRLLRKSHADYIDHTLTTALEEGNHRPFWGYIKSQRKDVEGVASLKENGKLHSSSTEKVEILGRQFSSVFTLTKWTRFQACRETHILILRSSLLRKKELLNSYNPDSYHLKPQVRMTSQIDC